MKEIWKDIKNYEGLYRVSNRGRVKSLYDGRHKIKREKMLTLFKKNTGYYQVTLSKNKNKTFFSVHRLVLSAFSGLCPNGMICLHLDDDGTNNNIENLKWGTYSENSRQMVARGRNLDFIRSIQGEKNPQAKLTGKDIIDIRKTAKKENKKRGWCVKLAISYKVSHSLISMVAGGKRWDHI